MHAATRHLLDLFDYEHLPLRLQSVSKELHDVAYLMTGYLDDGPELSTGLRKLLEAKDCFERQVNIGSKGWE